MPTEIDESTITIFCPCWGQRCLSDLERYALPSILQPGNLPACGYSKIIVRGSTIGHSEPLMRALQPGFNGIPGAELWAYVYGSEQSALLDGLRDTIRHCITTRTRMLLMMPDTIIANGGIGNMREYARGKPVSVAAPHLRVTKPPELICLPSIPEGKFPVMSPESLVRFAFANPHQSLTDSFSDRDNGTRYGGISLTRISDRLTTIIHHVVTTYLCWFTESDARFFDSVTAFRAFDHEWPKLLLQEQRLRVFGSSELFFAVELTEPHMNRIEVFPGTRLEEHSEIGHLALKPFVGALHG